MSEKNITLEEVNRRNAEFWETEQKKFQDRVEKYPDEVLKASKAIAAISSPSVIRNTDCLEDMSLEKRMEKIDFQKKGENFQPDRRKGAVAATTKYIADLAHRHPSKSAKALHREAIMEADSEGSPFSNEDDELWDKGKDEIFPLRRFEKRLSEIRNPKPETPKK